MEDNAIECTRHGLAYSALTCSVSFLAGGIAGATAALLLAPHSGKVTRAIIGRKVDDTADSARELKGRMIDTVNDAADSARDLKDRTIRRGQDLRKEATHRVEGAASALAGNGGDV